MTEQQIENHFMVHQKWARSLKLFPLAPIVVFHLDQQRNEYCSDGSVIKCSTREWAMTLKQPGGTPALCDVVNGTSDKKALVLVPDHYADHAKEELRQYRARLSPPSHREARFRDSVPDLPDVIHIQTAIESNVSFLDTLFSADEWSKPLASTPQPGNRVRKKKPLKPRPTKDKAPAKAWQKPPNIPEQQTAPTTALPALEDSALLQDDDLWQSDNRSTASTQGMTLASDSPFQARLIALESATKAKLQDLANTS